MNIRLSRHASEESKRRNINLNDIKTVLDSPDQIVHERDGIVCYQSIITEVGRQFLLRIMINEVANPKIVVTIYKTSKINRYWKP